VLVSFNMSHAFPSTRDTFFHMKHLNSLVRELKSIIVAHRRVLSQHEENGTTEFYVYFPHNFDLCLRELLL